MKRCGGEGLGPEVVGRLGQKGSYDSEFFESGANDGQVVGQGRRMVEFKDEASCVGQDSGCHAEWETVGG